MAYPWDVRKNEIFRGVEAARDVMSDVVAGRKTLALIGGGTGVGKTYNLRQTAKRHLIRYVPEDNPANAESLVSMTWQNRIWPVHALNECDHLLRSERSMNVLKLMHETPRKCALYTKEASRNEEYLRNGSKQYRESIPPTSFLLGNNCRHIVTSNLDYTDPAVTSQLPQEHWRALLRRGIDPLYIDTSSDLLLFQYVVWLGRDGKMLRAHQHTYSAASQAMNFYIQNANRLPDLSAGRLLMIADTIRDGRVDALDRMLTKTAVRDLQLEPATVQVLLWPRKPPKRRAKTRQNAPQRPPQARTAGPDAEPIVEPQATPEPPAASETPPEPAQLTLTLEQAVTLIYARREAETCESIASVLQRCSLSEWDRDDFLALAEQLQGAADWNHQHNDLAHAYFVHEAAPILFGTANGILLYRDGLVILSWGEVQEIMEPVLAEHERRRDLRRREEQAREIVGKKLPAKRKLKAMHRLIDEILALQPDTIRPDAVAVMKYVRGMTEDDKRFANCATFGAYLHAAEIAARGTDITL